MEEDPKPPDQAIGWVCGDAETQRLSLALTLALTPTSEHRVSWLGLTLPWLCLGIEFGDLKSLQQGQSEGEGEEEGREAGGKERGGEERGGESTAGEKREGRPAREGGQAAESDSEL